MINVDKSMNGRELGEKGEVKALGSVRIVPMLSQLERILKRYKGGDETYLFPTLIKKDRKHRITPFNKALKKLQIDTVNRYLVPHSFRYSVNEYFLAHFEIEKVMFYMGHRDITMTKRYTDHTPEKRMSIVQDHLTLKNLVAEEKAKTQKKAPSMTERAEILDSLTTDQFDKLLELLKLVRAS